MPKRHAVLTACDPEDFSSGSERSGCASNPSGRAADVETLFIQNLPALRGHVLALLPDFSRVDDIVQETFLTARRRAADFRSDGNFLAWICGIARYKILEQRRQESRAGIPLSDEVIDSLCAVEPEIDTWETELCYLRECLELLPAQLRQLIVLRYQQAHKPTEVARRIGWSTGSVYVALSRARGALRDCVARKMAISADRA